MPSFNIILTQLGIIFNIIDLTFNEKQKPNLTSIKSTHFMMIHLNLSGGTESQWFPIRFVKFTGNEFICFNSLSINTLQTKILLDLYAYKFYERFCSLFFIINYLVVIVVGQTVGSIFSNMLAYDCLCTLKFRFCLLYICGSWFPAVSINKLILNYMQVKI